MPFSDNKPYQLIYETVKEAANSIGLNLLRADEQQYAEELLPNIRTYMHGCASAIAVFDSISTHPFNPNVSFEVGYCMAMAKPVCLLKEKNLQALHSDLVGNLYYSFDVFDAKTIKEQLYRWSKKRLANLLE